MKTKLIFVIQKRVSSQNKAQFKPHMTYFNKKMSCELIEKTSFLGGFTKTLTYESPCRKTRKL